MGATRGEGVVAMPPLKTDEEIEPANAAPAAKAIKPAKPAKGAAGVQPERRGRGRRVAADYWNQPAGRRAELVDGELYDMAPPSRAHQRVVFGIAHAMRSHVEARGGSCEVDVAPFAVNLRGDESVFVEPDVLMVCDPSKLSDRGCEGAPDLVAEVVSPSNWKMDYFRKVVLYEAAGVREYWIVDPRCEQVAVYRFTEPNPLATYAFADQVPVGIWDGACKISVADLLV